LAPPGRAIASAGRNASLVEAQIRDSGAFIGRVRGTTRASGTVFGRGSGNAHRLVGRAKART